MPPEPGPESAAFRVTTTNACRKQTTEQIIKLQNVCPAENAVRAVGKSECENIF